MPSSTRNQPARTSTRSGSTSSNDTSIIGEEWEVESVIGKKLDEFGNLFYKLKWKNYNGDATWEPMDNCDCPMLINVYEKKISKKQEKIANLNSSTFDAITAAEAVLSGGSSSNRYSKSPAKMLSRGRATRVSVPSPSPSPTPTRSTRNNLKRI